MRPQRRAISKRARADIESAPTAFPKKKSRPKTGRRIVLALLIHSLIILPVLLGRKTRGILENAAEMRGRHKAGLFGNIRDALVGFLDQILRGLDAHTVDVLDQAEVDGLFKEAAEIVGADIKLAGNAGQGQLLRIMLLLSFLQCKIHHKVLLSLLVSAHFLCFQVHNLISLRQ